MKKQYDTVLVCPPQPDCNNVTTILAMEACTNLVSMLLSELPLLSAHNIQATCPMPLPPSLAPSSSNALTVEDVYQTTTGTAHNYKPSETLLQQPSYKKAPGSWKVNYTCDTIEKVRFYSQQTR